MPSFFELKQCMIWVYAVCMASSLLSAPSQAAQELTVSQDVQCQWLPAIKHHLGKFKHNVIEVIFNLFFCKVGYQLSICLCCCVFAPVPCCHA